MRAVKQLPLEPDPDVPSLAWIITQIITDEVQEWDCIIQVRGPRGSGKSTISVSLAISLAHELSYILNAPMIYFFNFWDNIKSVDKNGSMEMFSGDVIKKGYQVLIADDFGIAADSRDFMSNFNKTLVKIFTACRPYRAVIIMNSPEDDDVDKKIRRYAVLSIDAGGVYRKYKKNVCRVTINYKKKGVRELLGKYFRCKGKRITQWVSDRPPEWVMRYYKDIRMKGTNELLDEAGGKKETAEWGAKKPRSAEQMKESPKIQMMKTTYGDQVIDMYVNQDMKIKAIARELGLTPYIVDRCLEGVKR